jgi:hypothetical protein
MTGSGAILTAPIGWSRRDPSEKVAVTMHTFDFDDMRLPGDDERFRLIVAFVLPLLKFRDGHVNSPRNTSASMRPYLK